MRTCSSRVAGASFTPSRCTEGSSAADGFIGPPFQAVFFSPLAAIAGVSPQAAKLLWHVTGIACLIAGIAFTARAWWMARADLGLPPMPYLPALLLPLLAVLVPAQTNFEHQNMNALLLALIAAATWCLLAGSTGTAGMLIGVAAALKVFPALLIGVLVLRGRWRAALVASAVGIGLTLLPLPLYGSSAYARLIDDFSRLATSGFPVRVNNQSLVAALDRLVNTAESVGVREDAQLTLIHGMAAGVLLITLIGAILKTRRVAPAIAIQIPAAVTVAVLLSPIAWDHYWLLLLPAFVAIYDSSDERLLGTAGRYLFWIPTIMLAGLSPLTLGSHGFNVARSLSAYTVAALIAFAALTWMCARVGRAQPLYRANTTIHGPIAPTP